MHLDHEDVDEGAHDCADVRSDDRDPKVVIAAGKSLCPKDDGLEDSGSKVSRRVDGESGVGSKRESDAEDDETDQNWDQTFMGPHVFGISQSHDTNNEKKSTKNLVSEGHFCCSEISTWISCPNSTHKFIGV